MQVDWMPAAAPADSVAAEQPVVGREPGAGEPGAAGLGGETPEVCVAEQGAAGGAAGAAGAAGTADVVGDAAVGTVDLALVAAGADVVGADAPEQVVGQIAERQAALAQQLPAAGREGPRQQ